MSNIGPTNEVTIFNDRVIESLRNSLRMVISGVFEPETPNIAVATAAVDGHYRKSRYWNCVATVDGRQLGAVHALVIPKECLDETSLLTATDELLARALDASNAVSEDALRPWLGIAVIVEDDLFWHESSAFDDDTGSTRLDRMALFVEQVAGSRLLDAACVAAAMPDDVTRFGALPSPALRRFEAALAARTLVFHESTVRGRKLERSLTSG